jgi:hypothetical protein
VTVGYLNTWKVMDSVEGLKSWEIEKTEGDVE